MLKTSLLILLIALPLFGCVNTPEEVNIPEKFTQPAKTFQFDWPEKGIKATIEYKTRLLSHYKYIPNLSGCIREVAIENYGNKNFQYISINLSFYSTSKQLVATDHLSLYSGLISGGKANLPTDFALPEKLGQFTECPDSIDFANAKLTVS